MKRTNFTIKIDENGLPVKVYEYIQPTLAKRQASFGGHFRARLTALRVLESFIGEGIAFSGYKSNRDSC